MVPPLRKANCQLLECQPNSKLVVTKWWVVNIEYIPLFQPWERTQVCFSTQKSSMIWAHLGCIRLRSHILHLDTINDKNKANNDIVSNLSLNVRGAWHGHRSLPKLCNLFRFPGSLVVRIPRSHRGGRGSIPRLGRVFFPQCPYQNGHDN